MPVILKRDTLKTTAYIVVILAGSWWLLGQLAAVLRPLLLAIFLAYVLLPWYSRLRRAGLPAPLVIAVFAGFVAVLLLGGMEMVSVSVAELADELPALQARFAELSQHAVNGLQSNTPLDAAALQNHLQNFNENFKSVTSLVVSSTAGALLEAATVALYLLFILLGAEKLPERVRKAYPGEEGDRILKVAGGINSAIISYLRAKVKSSLILAVASGIVLACFGVKFITMWVLLTFLCNFIPYIGSAVSYCVPVAFAVLALSPGSAAAVAILLLLVQVASATLVEPLLIGSAVGLSPLLILAALAVWGAIWGVAGMFLAVPLTVVTKIILQNIEATKAFARLADE